MFGYTKEVPEENQTHRGYIFGYTKEVHKVNQTHMGVHILAYERGTLGEPNLWVYGVVVSMFDFHRSDRGSNPGRGGKIS